MWLLVLIVLIAVVGMVLEWIIKTLKTGAELSMDLLLEFFEGSIIDKLIFTIIIIAIALFIVNTFIWGNPILITLGKICAVAVVVLLVVKIIKLIFTR